MKFAIHHREVTESTNNDARAGSHGDVFTATEQTAGRGRIGHRWLSRPGDSLTFSVVLSVAGMPPEEAATLPLVAGLAVRRVAGGAIKWPNDVLVDGRKIAGILCERVGDNVICGIGINVNQTSFPPEIADRATSLRLVTGREQSVAGSLDRVLAELSDLYEQWFRGGFAALQPEIARHDALRGSFVRIIQTDSDPEPVEGICDGVMLDGSLSVAGVRIYAGEAHVCATSA